MMGRKYRFIHWLYSLIFTGMTQDSVSHLLSIYRCSRPHGRAEYRMRIQHVPGNIIGG